MNAVLVSFYTRDWRYPECARQLRADCERLGVDCHIVERPSVRGWLANTRQKPAFLLEALRDLQRPILWTDVDSSLLSAPGDLREDVDFMARKRPPHQERAWHVDTLYFNATTMAERLLELWIEYLTDHSDGLALHQAWCSGRWPGRAAPLPPEYHPGHPNAIIRYGRSTSPEKRADQRRLKREGRYAPL